jgi:hypothetical protein
MLTVLKLFFAAAFGVAAFSAWHKHSPLIAIGTAVGAVLMLVWAIARWRADDRLDETEPVTDPSLLAALDYMIALLLIVPAGTRDQVHAAAEGAADTPEHQQAESDAVTALEPLPFDVATRLEWLHDHESAAAYAALGVAAAEHLLPSQVRLLVRPWRAAGLPLLGITPPAELPDDWPANAQVTGVPYSPFGTFIPAEQVADLARLLRLVAEMSNEDRAALAERHAAANRANSNYPVLHWQAGEIAVSNGNADRQELLGMPGYRDRLPQFAADAALAFLLRDQLSSAAYEALAGTWLSYVSDQQVITADAQPDDATR